MKYFLPRWKYSNGWRIPSSLEAAPMTLRLCCLWLLVATNGQHNQLFASAAITYQLAEWLSGLSIGPSRLSCLSLLPATRRCRAKKKKNACWPPLHLGARQARAPSKKSRTLGRGWHCSEPVSSHLASASQRAHNASNLISKPSKVVQRLKILS